MLNKVFIIGNLGKDVMINDMKNGNKVCNISVATSFKMLDRGGKIKETTEWHKVVVFGKTAEFCAKYLAKGAKVLVEGRLRTQKYTDKNGVDKFTTEIVCERLQLLGQKKQQTGDSQEQKSNVSEMLWEDAPQQDSQDELEFF